jgi:hypothetical protein
MLAGAEPILNPAAGGVIDDPRRPLSAPSRPSTYALVHNSWTALRGERIGERLVLRRLRAGTGECWWLELAPGARAYSPGLAAEAVVSVVAGRLLCGVLGNEIELPAGHFLVIPPNLPLELRLCGRSPGAAMVHCGLQFGTTVPLEAI